MKYSLKLTTSILNKIDLDQDIKDWLLSEIESKDWMFNVEPKIDWSVNGRMNVNEFFILFKHEEDKIKFILKWL